jgi:alpha-amylase/alpha-mannosidase (GH57 family)
MKKNHLSFKRLYKDTENQIITNNFFSTFFHFPYFTAIPPRWEFGNISHTLIVRHTLIARNIVLLQPLQCALRAKLLPRKRTTMTAKKKFVCIHGHFYQPPRENAWLEVVEMQDSAAPFHDWNERINFECYAPNRAARILDHEQHIIKIVNNYAKISFNFGPTLLSWMEETDPVTHQAIIDADRQSMKRFNGHGCALAQVHSHLIMPLANERDKQTQVIWGIRDFEYRFQRKPEGIWLAETAANTETLEVLAEHGIQFTILAPRQAKAIRKIGTTNWHEVSDVTVDTRRPYLVKLPSGRSIAVFFYHGGIAQGVAFDGLLNNGKHFAQQFINAFGDHDEPQLVHIATDGESYGHHHHNGEMALADCLQSLDDNPDVELTNYGDFLEQFPPTYEAQIHENSSWSCVHGVERWRSDCGCNTGGRPGWNQAWRHPLRETLNWLRDELIPIYEKKATQYLRDVWDARNDYIDILLDRSPAAFEAFLQKNAKRKLNQKERTDLLRLIEMQRHAMLMFTSCGWFFSEISGIETDQILQYANRAIYYAHQVSGKDYHPEFLKRLQESPSNIHENGAVSYLKNVTPARVDLIRVGMHYAASSLFEAYPEHLEFFNYVAESEDFHRYEAGNQMLAYGRTVMKSKITQSEKHFSFAVLYLGQQNIIGNISTDMSIKHFEEMAAKVKSAFLSTNLGEVIGHMQSYFGSEKYSIWHLFRDEKRKILKQITDKSLDKVEKAFREIYNDNYQLMSGIALSDIPIPAAYTSAVEFIINYDLREYFNSGSLDNIRELKRLASELVKWKVQLTNVQAFRLVASERIFTELQDLRKAGMPLDRIEQLVYILETLQELHVDLDFWKAQNLYYSMLQELYANNNLKLAAGSRSAFLRLGALLKVRAEAEVVA